MKRLVMLPIETDPGDERLCGSNCRFADGKYCTLLHENTVARRVTGVGFHRLVSCLSATAQADRLVAVGDAGLKWLDRGRLHVDRDAMVDALESTRADAEGKANG